MFDPSVGRWLEEDPLGFEPGDGNLYRYSGNSPASEVDPSGLLPLPIHPKAPGSRDLLTPLSCQVEILEKVAKPRSELAAAEEISVDVSGHRQASETATEQLASYARELEQAAANSQNPGGSPAAILPEHILQFWTNYGDKSVLPLNGLTDEQRQQNSRPSR